MAANELFDSGIKVTGSFSAAGAFPVDGKFIVKSIAERDDHDTQNRSYEGMLVYVQEDGKTYQKQKTGWKEFGFNAEDFEGSVYDGLDSDSAALALSARQGKVLNEKITAHEADNVKHITTEERQKWNAKADTTEATNALKGLMSAADKAKLDGIAPNANNYVHPDNASTRHVTDAQIAEWTAKASADLAEAGTKDGLMSKEDKAKLDGIEAGANNYVHPNDTNTRHVSDAEKATWNAKAEKTTATISDNGLMSATDKKKLDAIEEGANKYVHPNDTNTRHVTDAQIAKWDAKADTTIATTSNNGLMSATDKTKLDKLKIEKIENMKYTMPHTEFTSTGKVKISIDNITSESTITIGLDYTSVTSEQYDAAGLAKFKPVIVDGGIEVSCFGVRPSVDIPVSIAIVREI